MSRDRTAVVWTRMNGSPRKMGQLYVTDQDCRFSYDVDYLACGQPGIGLVLSPSVFKDRTIIRKRSETFDFLPPIQALIPPHGESNFQRSLLMKYLKTRGISGLSRYDMDWEILKVAGHGGIGHVDVFENDEKAMEWYSSTTPHQLFEITDDFGFSLKEFLGFFDDGSQSLLDIIGPTPTVNGAIPKLLLSIPKEGWNGKIGLPTRKATPDVTDVVLKFEQDARYPGIVELEAVSLELHKTAGFAVPRFWKTEIMDIPAIAIERFDRDENGSPLFAETWYSIIASGNPDILNHYDFTYDGIAKAMSATMVTLVDNPIQEKLFLLKRLLLSFLTGNGDLHLENMTILKTAKGLESSPVYDPTPMRAYSIHNMLNVMPFGDYAEFISGQEEPVKFHQAMGRFIKSCGITKTAYNEITSELLDVTKQYPDVINDLKTLPDRNKSQLINIHRQMANKLKTKL